MYATATYGADGNDFTSRLLDLLELLQEVPETRLGDNLVRGKKPHAVKSRGRLFSRRHLSANNFVLVELHIRKNVYSDFIECVIYNGGKKEQTVSNQLSKQLCITFALSRRPDIPRRIAGLSVETDREPDGWMDGWMKAPTYTSHGFLIVEYLQVA